VFYLNNPKNQDTEGQLCHYQQEAKQNRNSKSICKPPFKLQQLSMSRLNHKNQTDVKKQQKNYHRWMCIHTKQRMKQEMDSIV
jgi:hypothetical protein